MLQHKKFKKLISNIHLWLGLSSGILVFIIAITGCIYVFQDEIKDVVYKHRFVKYQETNFVKPSLIFDLIEEKYPNSQGSMVVYNGKYRSAAISIMVDEVPYTIYLNPYSGEIIHEENLETEFFMVIENLHRFLLLPEEIGKQVTGIATIIFILMLLSGLVLWWPKKLKSATQNFKIRWKAKWRRKNYDLHRTFGFYIILPSLFLAITGLAFTYEVVEDGLFTIGNIGEDSVKKQEPIQFDNIEVASSKALDASFFKTQELSPNNNMLFVWKQFNGLPIVTGAYPKALVFDNQSNFLFHPVNGDLLETQYFKDKLGGTKLQEINFGLHTGQYLGLFGKVMAFLASLLVASLPVTGFLIWYGRKKRKKNNFI
ncbi:PepSY domain-containing protein [Polaribacter sp. Hel_I_88]|uniref:PepSY-associated TM helix domain-containing protein n=1 Tax=Polaribacter sp. Hel_I_88 TaxID=1250006 RepID=UPI00047D94CA|nr:PepSY-associated TM helix domain-containing protein [Polaribacter sp. Hel_I_88]